MATTLWLVIPFLCVVVVVVVGGGGGGGRTRSILHTFCQCFQTGNPHMFSTFSNSYGGLLLLTKD